MKAIKIFSTLCITLFFLQCGSANFDKKPPFKIHSATFYNSTTDLQKSSNSNMYIRYTSKNNINFDSLYFRNKKIKVQIKTIRGLKYVFGEFQNKMIIRDFVLDANPIKELKNKIPKADKFPFDLKENEGVISYQLKGETKYFKIKNIQKRDSGSYPIKQ